MSRFIRSLLATSIMLSSNSSFADLAKEPGFDFYINVNMGVGHVESQNNSIDDNEITADLNNSGKEENLGLIQVLGRVSYTLANKKTQLFLGSDEHDIEKGNFKAELGLSQVFANSTVLTLAYTPLLPILDAWQDPFVSNQKRLTTDVDSQGARVRLDNLFMQAFSVEYRWSEFEYENDQSGQQQNLQLTTAQQALLQRDSNLHQAALEYDYVISQRFSIQPELTLTRGDSKGDAMSFDQIGLQTALVSQLSERSKLVSSIYFGHAKFDTVQPIFDKVREDKHYAAFIFYSYARPFNWNNTTFSAMAGYSQNDSNINFYNKESALASIGMSYRF